MPLSRGVTSFFQDERRTTASLDRFGDPRRFLSEDALLVLLYCIAGLLCLAGEGAFDELTGSPSPAYSLSWTDWLFHLILAMTTAVLLLGIQPAETVTYRATTLLLLGSILGGAGLLPHLDSGILSNAVPDWRISSDGMVAHRLAVTHSSLIPAAILALAGWVSAVRWLAIGSAVGIASHLLGDLVQCGSMYRPAAVVPSWGREVVVGFSTFSGAIWLLVHAVLILNLVQVAAVLWRD